MRCPFCRDTETRVLDSRDTEEGCATRRRRECGSCGRRFTTYERVDGGMLTVRKKDGRMEPFEPSKIRAGIQIACEKRPVNDGQIDALVLGVENSLRDEGAIEVTSEEIGRRVMEVLRELDPVAYVRFASVYEEFAEAGRFVSTVRQLEGPEPPEGEGSSSIEAREPADAVDPERADG
jgi:transcriptional repressor NrdR